MENENIVTIPFVAHESAMNRMERANKRLWIIIIIMIISAVLYLIIPTEIADNTQEATSNSDSTITQTIEE